MKNMCRIAAVVCALAGVTLNVQAYTVDQIIGSGEYKDAADETYFSTEDKYGYPETPLGHSSHIRLSKVIEDDRTGVYSTTKIKVEGFTGFTGSKGEAGFVKADFTFVLANENGVADADGEYLYLENDAYIASSGSWYNPSYTAKGPNASTDGKYYIMGGKHQDEELLIYPYTFGSKRSTYLYNYYDWYGKITETADGEYRIEFSDPAIMSSAANDPSAWISGFRTHFMYIIDHYAIETFTPNATFKCKVVPFTYNYDDRGSYGTPVEKEIPVKYTLNGDDTFTVLNLTDEGFAIGRSETSMSAPRLYTGKYDSETGTATLDGGQYGYLMTRNIREQNARTFWHYGGLTTVRTGNSIFDKDFKDVVIKTDHTGEASVISHLYHFTPKTRWVTNGGHCRTYVSTGTMKLQPFAFVSYGAVSDIYQYDSSSAFTDGEFDSHEDVTLDISHEVETFAKSDTEFYVKSDMTVAKNDQYVDSYELWMAPEKDQVDVNSGYFTHEENGHELGQMLARVYTGQLNGSARVRSRAAGATNHRFQVQMPLSSIQNVDENGKYVFYIKANYTPESGLGSTFHGLSAPDPISTGVDHVWGEVAEAEVKAVAGGIEVTGAEGTVEVHTPGGALIYHGEGGFIGLESGLYVVSANGNARKVAVR